MTQKFDKKICHYQTFFKLKNTFKVVLQYLFNVFILCNTVCYLKLNFKRKIDPKMRPFKNREEILKTWRKFLKNIWQPWYNVQILERPVRNSLDFVEQWWIQKTKSKINLSNVFKLTPAIYKVFHSSSVLMDFEF